MTLDALDELDRARALIELIKMACREADDDLNAIATGLCATGVHLDRAAAKLQGAPNILTHPAP